MDAVFMGRLLRLSDVPLSYVSQNAGVTTD